MDKIGFLFDLDGVLIDSEREYTRIWTEIERRYPTGKDNFALIIKGQTLPKILNDHFEESVRKDVNDLLHLLEEEITYSYCPGASGFIDDLHSRSAKMAVVTSSDAVKMAHLYQDLPEFKSKFNAIVDASKVKKSKPDPEGYLLGARHLGVDIAKCAVFEDSVQGVMAGKASGAYVIGLTGTKTREDLSPYADIIVDSLMEINIDSLSELLETR